MGFHHLVDFEIDSAQPEFTDYHDLFKLFLLVSLFETGEDVEVVRGYPFFHFWAVLLEIYDLVHYFQDLYQFLRDSASDYHDMNHLYYFLLIVLVRQSFE